MELRTKTSFPVFQYSKIRLDCGHAEITEVVHCRKKSAEGGKHPNVPRGTENQHSPEGRKVAELKIKEDLQVVLTRAAQLRAIPNIQKQRNVMKAFASMSEQKQKAGR